MPNMPTSAAGLQAFAESRTLDALRSEANALCESVWGRRIFVRGLIEFSNHCARNCLYCGIRGANTGVSRYRLSTDDIVGITREGFRLGIRTFVLQGGEDPFFSVLDHCRTVEHIRDATEGKAAITLSLGIRPRGDYAALKAAGADRYLLRFETSDEALHVRLRAGVPFAARRRALDDLKELDYEVGSGFMTGLPGETEETFYENVLLCKALELDMVGIGPFIPHPDTPLWSDAPPSLERALRAVALVRLLLPLANMPATTAAGSIDPLGREKMLLSGANVLMPNLSPPEAKRRYLLYPGKVCLDEEGFACTACLKNSLPRLGKELVFDRGNAKSAELRHAG